MKFYSREPELTVAQRTFDYPRSTSFTTYKYPEHAIYLLGAKDSGLLQDILGRCDDIIQIPASISLNVAVAGSIVLYDRNVKSRANV